MLAKEKKRAFWSFAMGATFAVAVFGYKTIALKEMDATLAKTVAACWASPTKNGHPVLKGVTVGDSHQLQDIELDEILKCTPSDLEYESNLIEPEQKVHDAYDAEEGERDNLEMLLAGALAIALMPFVWYFLLDRIREITAAVTGRDQP
jgi:hypothetical protein